MVQYLELLNKVLNEGKWKNPSREGMPRTKSIFGHQMRFDLREGFPLVTTKEVNFKNIVTELLWFLRGDINIKFLVDNGCNIWNEDAYNYYLKLCKKQHLRTLNFEEFGSYIKKAKSLQELAEDSKRNWEVELPLIPKNYILGDCGKQYGWLWKYQEKYKRGEYVDNEQGYVYYTKQVDQVKNLIEGLLKNPESRRHIISAWNPATLDEMALPACHPFVQFNCTPLDVVCDDLYMTPKYSLDCKFTMRSSDLFLGLPYNIASYALLTHIICRICNMVPGELICDLGDVHLYENHMSQAIQQLLRDPKNLPTLKINEKIKTLRDFETIEPIFYQGDFQLENYNPHPKIKAKLSTGLK